MNEYYVVFRTRNYGGGLTHSRRKIKAPNEQEAIRIAAGKYDTTPGLAPGDRSTAYDIHAELIEEIEP